MYRGGSRLKVDQQLNTIVEMLTTVEIPVALLQFSRSIGDIQIVGGTPPTRGLLSRTKYEVSSIELSWPAIERDRPVS